jgi:hypothetical protein
MKMTYTDALTFAIDTLSAMEQTEQTAKVIEKMDALRTTYANRNANRVPMSDEAKQARKDATAAKRAELVAQVAPILRSVIDHDMTAKEIFAAAQAQLPEGFTAPKVQNILIREMAPELVRTERKKGGDLYRLAD